MKKWDYKAEHISLGWGGGIKKLEKILNIYGEDGYELVLADKDGLYIFKKQIENL